MDKMIIDINNFDKTSDGYFLVPENILNNLVEYCQETYVEKQREIVRQIESGKLKAYTLDEAQKILEDGHF